MMNALTLHRPWTDAIFRWLLEEPTAIEPIACCGAQGIWRVPVEIEREVRRRVEIARAA